MSADCKVAPKITGTPVDEAMEVQRMALWAAHGIIKLAEAAVFKLADEVGAGEPLSRGAREILAPLEFALRHAAAVVSDAVCALDPVMVDRQTAGSVAGCLVGADDQVRS